MCLIFHCSFYYYFCLLMFVLGTKDCKKSLENNLAKHKIVGNKIGNYNGIFKKLQTNSQA